MMSEDWLHCQGIRPRLARWLRRFRWQWVERWITRRLNEAEDDLYTARILQAVLGTGRPVVGSVEEDGSFVLRVLQCGDDER